MTEESVLGPRRPLPRLDHVMVLLDGLTYRAIADSDFVGERFGRLQKKEADSSVAGQYTTLGVAGDNTLIELFGADLPAAVPLTGGLVFSFELPGSAARAQRLLDASGQVKYHHELVERAVAGEARRQPWYHLISVDLGEASPLLLFLNEVTPEYFAGLGAQPAPDGALRRRDYLDAVLGPAPAPPRLMRDIVAVRLLVDAERARRIADALTPFGFAAAESDGICELSGPDLTIELKVEESERGRISEIRMLVTGDVPYTDEQRRIRFGDHSVLTIEPGGLARWRFGPLD